jgi:hypothetical protein
VWGRKDVDIFVLNFPIQCGGSAPRRGRSGRWIAWRSYINCLPLSPPPAVSNADAESWRSCGLSRHVRRTTARRCDKGCRVDGVHGGLHILCEFSRPRRWRVPLGRRLPVPRRTHAVMWIAHTHTGVRTHTFFGLIFPIKLRPYAVLCC